MSQQPTASKHTMNKEFLFVGLDVHAKSLTLALAEGGGGEARLYGTIPNDLHAVEKVFAKLKKAHPGAALRVCYEAGPTGFVARAALRATADRLPGRGALAHPASGSGSRPTGATRARWRGCIAPLSWA